MTTDPYAHEDYGSEYDDECAQCRVLQLEVDALRARIARTECDHCHHSLPVSGRSIAGHTYCGLKCGLAAMAQERELAAIRKEAAIEAIFEGLVTP